MADQQPLFEDRGDDELMPCCGHSRRMHTPKCRHWTPGTRLDVPHDCGCPGTPEMQQAGASNAPASSVGRTSKKR
jgi:hypothetical protein